MRLHRAVALLAFGTVLAALPAPAGAQLVLRGNYWRDRNTRVFAPEAEATKELPSGTTLSTGYLLDAISSASAASGAAQDRVFTEMRNQFSFRVAQRIGPVALAGSYRYSTESDYWAHVAGATVGVDLFQKNTSLSAGFYYNSSEVGRRAGPTGYIPVGHLKARYFVFSAAQVLSRNVVVEAIYELSDEGDPNDPQSFLANAYRTTLLSGTGVLEMVPRGRMRHAVTAVARASLLRAGPFKYIALQGRYRFYIDNWGITAHAPELRSFFGLGPVELRLTGRYYTQTGTDFWRERNGVPSYDEGVRREGCPPTTGCYTGDAKLSPFDSIYFDVRLSLALEFLRHPRIPLGGWLGDGMLSINAGRYVNSAFAWRQFGNAWVGGVEIVLPL